MTMDRHGSPGLAPRHDASSRVSKASDGSSASDKLAALRARVNAALSSSQARGGLSVGLHPMLQETATTTASTSSSWKPTSGSGNKGGDAKTGRSGGGGGGSAAATARRAGLGGSGNVDNEASVKNNPYIDTPASHPSSKGQGREKRSLIFNQKGKFIAQANALRRQAALEQLKKKIAAQTKKAGIDEDIDVEKGFLVEEPPGIEWWDEGLLDAENYDCLDDLDDLDETNSISTSNPAALKIEGPESIVTRYIQHPVAIEAPQETLAPAPKPMYLTPKEMKKTRRQRRMAQLKEDQAKQRLGLVPTPQPKVKKGNLMRVLGEEAVKDPTKVEAMVNKQIQDRHDSHLQVNEDRKLTTGQRHEKLAKNQEADAAKGLHMLCFKIDSLVNGQHRFKINKNAEQHALTGVCIMNPKFNLLIVEGGAWSIKHYRKLMVDRIDWTENVPSRDRGEEGGSNDALREWLKAEDENTGLLKDMGRNRCRLLWEGEVKTRGFKMWKSRVCETDAEAREVLARAKLENMWNLAKSTV